MEPPVRVAINGFGRIGRQVVRQVAGRADVEIVAVNNTRGSPSTAAQLFKYDSIYGRYPGDVAHDEHHLVVDGQPIRVLRQPEPLLCPWHALGVEVVVEATGRFTQRAACSDHLKAGARKVVVTAPARDADLTVVVGVNDDRYNVETMQIVSAASCTTNCLAPMVKVLHEQFGVVGGLVTTIHAFTRDQEIHDTIHEDPRRGRAASLNMTPTRTGAAKAIDAVLPELAGRLVGIAVRVPVPDVSLTDLSVILDRATTVEDINNAFVAAAAGDHWHGVLAASDEPLVSTDYVGDHHSCTVDLPSTRGGPQHQFKVLGWYDNEAGYAARVVDLVGIVAGRRPATRAPALPTPAVAAV